MANPPTMVKTPLIGILHPQSPIVFFQAEKSKTKRGNSGVIGDDTSKFEKIQVGKRFTDNFRKVLSLQSHRGCRAENPPPPPLLHVQRRTGT